MRARLTHISLTIPGRIIQVGEIVERGVDLPEALFDARLAGQTAELVGDQDDAVSHELEAAIASFEQASRAHLESYIGMVAIALEQGAAAAVAVVEAIEAAPRAGAHLELFAHLETIRDRARLAYQARIPSPGDEHLSGAEAGGDAASEPGDAVTGGPSPGENSSGDGRTGGEGIASADGAGVGQVPAPNASTDAPQPTAGMDGDAAGAQPPAAEPAPPGKPSTAAKSPARKGRGKG